MESSLLSRVHASTSAASPASTKVAASVDFPAQEGSHSLADMARRDLDAALQLLADRAQYITGASGAAIALRRNGKKDMLCRASTGSNAPELGALLSTEFGLSGESVRTRQPLRCDDAERDARVNREVCRQLGIASVVVMPVVNDDEVLGVFELFSGEVNAFCARDLSAVQRLSEMVKTAVRLAEAVERLPERLRMSEISAPTEGEQDKVLGGQVLEEFALEGPLLGKVVAEELILEDAVLEDSGRVLEIGTEAIVDNSGPGASGAGVRAENVGGAADEPLKEKILIPSQEAAVNKAMAVEGTVLSTQEPPKDTPGEPAVATPPVASPRPEPVSDPSAETAPSKKQLFWSAALNPSADAARPEEEDQSHVPLVLRSLHKCQACGFPVSPGRLLCVECDEKKWRGQLRVPKAGAPRQVATPAAAAPVAAPPKAEARAFAAAQSAASSAQAAAAQIVSRASSVLPLSPAVRRKESRPAAHEAVPAAATAVSLGQKTASPPSAQTSEVSSSDFVFSAGSEPSESWLSANKYVMGVLLVLAVAVAAFVFFR